MRPVTTRARPVRRRVRRLVLLALPALLLALPACSAGTEEPSVPPAAAPPLTVTFRQYRDDAVRRLVSVSVLNTGARPVRVEAVRLDAPAFAPLPPTRPDGLLAPGERTDFRVPVGAVRCDGVPAVRASAAGTPSGAAAGTQSGPLSGGAVVSAAAGGSPAVEQRLAFTGGTTEFARLVGSECDAQRVAAVADLAWGPTWTPGRRDGSVRGVLQVRRRAPAAGAGAPAELVVDQIGGSVLLTLWTLPEDARPVARLAPDQRSVDVPVEATVGRCDGHALADSKKTFLVPVWVGVGGATPTQVIVTATGPARTALQAHIDDVCSQERT